MHKAERPSNYFSNTYTHNQAEQIKKGVLCVQILLEIHLTLNTVESISRLNNYITYLSWSQKITVGIPAYPSI